MLAEHSVEMTLVGKTAEKRDFLQGQMIFTKMVTSVLNLSFQNEGVWTHTIMRAEFARELDRSAVADAS